MADRALTVRRDDALFVKDGVPIKFCFHKSVTQGRGQMTRNVERHGGQIVPHERLADVLLIDEQENLALFRRRYYSSTERYRLSLYVEPRGFIQACIHAGAYRHIAPIKQGMPGRAPGGGKGTVKERVPFTEEDRDHLAYYLATRCPTRDGRLGVNAYKDLVRLGQTDDRSWAWARRHTSHSWREHYKMNPGMMDVRIDYYLQRLKDVGHHLGHDPRTHDHQNSRQEQEEDEEDDGEEGEEQGGRRSERRDHERQEQVRQAVAEEDDIQEVAIQKPRRVKRHRVPPNVHHQRDFEETQAKRARVSEVSTNERQASDIEAGRGEGSSAREEGTDETQSEGIEGSDLFGDRAYEESRFDFDSSLDFPAPFSPRTSPAPEQDGPPLSTQATLIASPLSTEKDPTSMKVVEVTRKTVPPSSQQTLVMTQERVMVQRARVRGVSAQPGPSMPKETVTQDAVVGAPYRNTRARSRSVDPQPQPQLESESQLPQQREGQGGRGKGKAKEVILDSIEEDIHVEERQREGSAKEHVGPVPMTVRETFEDEMAVEGLLEASVGDEGDDEDEGSDGGEHDDSDGSGDGDEEGDIMPELPRFQEIEIEGEPSDSDDAETHASLVRGVVVREGSFDGDDASKGGEPVPDQDRDQNEGEEDSDDDDADRIRRMANRKLQATSAPTPLRPRVTRSMAATQTQTQQISPRQTRSGSQVRAASRPTVLPRPETKARAMVGRLQEERRTGPGTRAAKTVKERGRRG